jgi:hypothetical protein
LFHGYYLLISSNPRLVRAEQACEFICRRHFKPLPLME